MVALALALALVLRGGRRSQSRKREKKTAHGKISAGKAPGVDGVDGGEANETGGEQDVSTADRDGNLALHLARQRRRQYDFDGKASTIPLKIEISSPSRPPRSMDTGHLPPWLRLRSREKTMPGLGSWVRSYGPICNRRRVQRRPSVRLVSHPHTVLVPEYSPGPTSAIDTGKEEEVEEQVQGILNRRCHNQAGPDQAFALPPCKGGHAQSMAGPVSRERESRVRVRRRCTKVKEHDKPRVPSIDQ